MRHEELQRVVLQGPGHLLQGRQVVHVSVGCGIIYGEGPLDLSVVDFVFGELQEAGHLHVLRIIQGGFQVLEDLILDADHGGVLAVLDDPRPQGVALHVLQVRRRKLIGHVGRTRETTMAG